MTPECPPGAARCYLPKRNAENPAYPPANEAWRQNAVGTSGLRFPWWPHSAALPIGQASCSSFSNRGSDTHLLPDWPGCAAAPWQQGQRDQSLQNLSHHLPGVELRSRGMQGMQREQVAPTSAHSQVGDAPLWDAQGFERLVGFISLSHLSCI